MKSPSHRPRGASGETSPGSGRNRAFAEKLIRLLDPQYLQRWEIYDGILKRLTGPDTRWLDGGCGKNIAVEEFPCALNVGMDISRHSELRGNAGVFFVMGDLERVPFRGGAFTLATLNTVAVASRRSITVVRPFSAALDPRHLLCAETAGIRVCAAYLPVRTELRVPHLKALAADGRAQGIGLIVGDFNTGKSGVDTSSPTARFPRSDLLDSLAAAGYTDLWRAAHLQGREYSYYSRKDGLPYNGFRIDHAFAAPELTRRVVRCEYDHTPREVGETDHAALSVWVRR